MRAEFKNTFADVLRRRLSPNTAVHVEQLAYAIGYEPATVRNWLRSSNEPSGAAVAARVHFFASQGDVEILTSLFPGVAPLVQRKAKAERALQFMETLAQFAPNAEGAAA